VDQRDEIEMHGVVVRVLSNAASDRGAVRTLNEDSVRAEAPVWIVADGMGGHERGDLASRAAVDAFTPLISLAAPRPSDVLDAVRAANDGVRAVPGSGMSGTTLTGLVLVEMDGAGPHWMAVNIGDSRTYRWDGRELEQQSIDHSVTQELLDQGLLTPEEALLPHAQRNVVTRALGADDEVEADVWLLPVRGRQTFLLCSDGLTKELADDEIARIIVFHDQQRARDADGLTLAERLVGAAIAAGGRDNVSVVVVESHLVDDVTTASEDTVDRDHALVEDTVPRG
jgi:serine/threonine protein phosphatase PrpC